MNIRVSHFTRFEYDERVSFSPHKILLRPREGPGLRLRRYQANLNPPTQLRWTRDPYDNFVGTAHFWEPDRTLDIRVEFEVETPDFDPFDFLLDPHGLEIPPAYTPAERTALHPCLQTAGKGDGDAIDAWLRDTGFDAPAASIPWVTQLALHLHENLKYAWRHEFGVFPPAETLSRREGSCRDFATLFNAICRRRGLAARFVSGYLFDPETELDPADSPDTPAEPRPQTGTMHAWSEVYLPGGGWRGVDPTHGIFCHNAFVPTAVADEPARVSPIQGIYYHPTRVNSQMSAAIKVERIKPVG